MSILGMLYVTKVFSRFASPKIAAFELVDLLHQRQDFQVFFWTVTSSFRSVSVG